MKRSYHPNEVKYILQNRGKYIFPKEDSTKELNGNPIGRSVSSAAKEADLYQFRKENIRINLRMKAAKVTDQKVITWLRVGSFMTALTFVIIALCCNNWMWSSPAVIAIVGSLWKKGPG